MPAGYRASRRTRGRVWRRTSASWRSLRSQLYGAYQGASDAVGKALVADVVPPAQRATEYGILNMATGLVLLPASILAGLLWGGVGPHAPFWFGAGCAAAAVVLLGFINRRSRAGSPEADRERASRT